MRHRGPCESYGRCSDGHPSGTARRPTDGAIASDGGPGTTPPSGGRPAPRERLGACRGCAPLGVGMATKSSAPADTTTSTATSSTTARTRSGASPDPGPARKTYVIDTSVLLSDPRAMMRFAEHEVVLPVVVVTELEGKRHHPEL